MSDVLERFLRYVQVDSQSNPANEEQVPSSPCEHEMARMLGEELVELGCTDVVVDEHAYVTATFAASAGAEDAPALMLCAHMDSASDAPASGIKPHIVHYEGGELFSGYYTDGDRIVSTPESVPDLVKFVGQDIVVTDGTTLLSADDKAGIAEICALLKRLKDNPALPHPTIKVAFVPDEEIGHGAALLDLEKLGATYGYTVDGHTLGGINFECFSASMATVTIEGIMVHPGSAKGIMINAVTLAGEFLSQIPADERPENTEGREGFYHPMEIKGAGFKTVFSLILRDFDSDVLAQREQKLRDIAASMNEKYGAGTVTVAIREQYRNMAEHFDGLEFMIDYACDANREVGIHPFIEPIRGGTDGAQLTFRGLPCPNLATGAYNLHSIREFIPVPSLEITVDMLEHLVAKFAARKN